MKHSVIPGIMDYCDLFVPLSTMSVFPKDYILLQEFQELIALRKQVQVRPLNYESPYLLICYHDSGAYEIEEEYNLSYESSMDIVHFRYIVWNLKL